MDNGGQNQLKMFTVQEAESLIPKLTQIISRLQEERRRILALEVQIDAVELVADKDADGIAPALSRKVDEYKKAVAAFYAGMEEVHGIGCFLKDLDIGLVDFYALHQGRVVYLCWRLGESRIGHWHEVGKGYTSREPLNSEP